ncbi:MAG: hypothetical protein FWG50_02850 [Kiritimatiellaeota bacterium]|nr:hypothetical protein [Kiritimatiellota bacterium]
MPLPNTMKMNTAKNSFMAQLKWGCLVMIALMALFHGCGKTRELAFTDIEMSIEFSATENGEFSKIFITYKNTSKNSRILVLPIPADEDAREEPVAPLLVISLQNKNGEEDGFLYTLTDGDPMQKLGKIMLASGEATTVEYQLSTFWRWGPCGPNRDGSFSDHIRAGNDEVEAKVVLMKNIDTNREDAESKPQKLLCSFPPNEE